MMRSGDYVVPTFEGQPRLVKPPMLHWVQTALFQLGGPNEMLADSRRTATFMSLLLVGWIGWRRFGVEGAAWAGGLLPDVSDRRSDRAESGRWTLCCRSTSWPFWPSTRAARSQELERAG
jgi:hypothetical protein